MIEHIAHLHAAFHIAIPHVRTTVPHIAHVHIPHVRGITVHHPHAPGVKNAPGAKGQKSHLSPRFHYPHAGNVVPESVSYP